MNSTIRAGLIGASIGGASMFLLDPDRGARRRALVRDKAVRVARRTRDAADATRRDLGNRLAGLRSTRARLSGERIDDVRLRERVRAALGRATSHSRAIAVDAYSGCVTLTGDALEAEIPAIVSAVEDVRGVEGVQNAIRPHQMADGIPSLQGASDRPMSWSAWIREGWSPTALVIAGVATGAVAFTAAALARSGNGRASSWSEQTPFPLDAAFVTEVDVLAIDTVPSDTGPLGDTEGLL